jgi:hypothetical protein
MHFLNLPGFNPATGISTDKHSKFPFISSVNGLFEPDPDPFNYQGMFSPFEQIEMDQQKHFYISEPNLKLVFKPGIAKRNMVLIDSIRPASQEYINELKADFYKGYQSGLADFTAELGPTYNALSIAHQQEILIAFMAECHHFLYFEGFAIPQVLFSLGYIQANLVLAYKEYRNIKDLTRSLNAVLETDRADQTIQQKEPDNAKTDYPKIPIKYSSSDILQLWLVLIDIHECQTQVLTQAFKSEKEIKTLLGNMFIDLSNKQSIIPETPHGFYELPQNYQVILNLLMHATYKLNYTYTNLKLLPYAQLLKDTFSTYNSIDVTYIGSNITKKLNEAVALLQELRQSSRAMNALKILEKIPQYAPHLKRR